MGADGQDIYEEAQAALAQAKPQEGETKEDAEKRVLTKFSHDHFHGWLPGGHHGGGSTEEGLGGEHQAEMNMEIYRRLQKKYGIKPATETPQGGEAPSAAPGGEK